MENAFNFNIIITQESVSNEYNMNANIAIETTFLWTLLKIIKTNKLVCHGSVIKEIIFICISLVANKYQEPHKWQLIQIQCLWCKAIKVYLPQF